MTITADSRFRFSAIGTSWEVVTPEPLDPDVADAVVERVEDFDQTYSRFRSDSLVAAMTAASTGGEFLFPPDAVALFDLYDQLHTITDGAVDPLVGRDLEMLGYDAGYTLRALPPEVRAAERSSRPRWTADVERDGHVLRTRRPVVVDVGAAGKGHLVDLVTTLLHKAGIDHCTVDAGGDLRHTGPQPLRVGLEHPTRPGRVVGVISVRDQALCASAVNRRAWGPGLHHVVDPRTGTPIHQVIATWAVAETALLADGLATALFFTSGAKLRHCFSFSSVQMLADHSLVSSPDLHHHLFL